MRRALATACIVILSLPWSVAWGEMFRATRSPLALVVMLFLGALYLVIALYPIRVVLRQRSAARAGWSGVTAETTIIALALSTARAWARQQRASGRADMDGARDIVSTADDALAALKRIEGGQ